MKCLIKEHLFIEVRGEGRQIKRALVELILPKPKQWKEKSGFQVSEGQIDTDAFR